MQASDFFLGGPVWLFAQAVIFGTLILSVFVLFDSLLPRRRAKLDGRLREPLWVYSAAVGLYLALVLGVQVIPGFQVAAAVVAVATPFALAVGVAYLLRAVFPKPEQDGSAGNQSPSADIVIDGEAVQDTAPAPDDEHDDAFDLP